MEAFRRHLGQQLKFFHPLKVMAKHCLRFNWILTNKLFDNSVDRLFSVELIHVVLKDIFLKVLFMFAVHRCSLDVSGFFRHCVSSKAHFFLLLVARIGQGWKEKVFLISRGEALKNILVCRHQMEAKWVLHICKDIH